MFLASKCGLRKKRMERRGDLNPHPHRKNKTTLNNISEMLEGYFLFSSLIFYRRGAWN
jgi:hypothetical protein